MRNRLVHLALALGLALALFGAASAAAGQGCKSRAFHASNAGHLHSSNKSVLGLCYGGGSE